MFLNTVYQNITHWIKEGNLNLNLSGISEEQWIFLANQYLRSEPLCNKSHLFLFSTSEKCEEFYETIKNHLHEFKVLLVPGLEVSPYSGIIASERNLYERFYALNHLTQFNQDNKPIVCLASIESFLLKNPPPTFFKDESFPLSISDIISPLDLAKRLTLLGYSNSTSVEEPGSFSQKGEIFDIFPIASDPVRIHYFDDMIEAIFAIDLSTYKTNRNNSFESILITAAPAVLIQQSYSNILRENITMPSTQYRERLEKRKSIFSQISQGYLFENYPAFIPLFFKQHSSLLDFFPKNSKPIIHLVNSFKLTQESQIFLDLYQEEFERLKNDIHTDSILPQPEKLYYKDLDSILENHPVIHVDEIELKYNFDSNIQNHIELKLEKAKTFLSRQTNPSLPKHEFILASLEFIKEKFKHNGTINFSYGQLSTLDEFKHLIEITKLKDALKDRIHFSNYPLESGFYYENEKLLVLADGDLFSRKKPKIKSPTKSNVDLFAEQLATLKEGDYIIHNEHGVGEYLGLKSIEVGGQLTDYLVLLYSGNDKVYVPVYKMNLIQKHAENTAELRVDSLRTNKFSNAKKRARESAKKLAFDLLKLQAKRESTKAFSFEPPDHNFKEFELSFPFQETPDQIQAIQDILESMQKPKPMDHLVCGDVGFGKTEVAMRAAFKAVLDRKQVAILVPTTILALQHFNSFKKRFQNFAVNIEYLSRFKSAKESSLVFDKLSKGKIDIIIGTHKLLSSKVVFFDLGLVIVDEEQRFGVSHKEKLKLLKASVDFLTLTATPIPRTLQMTFLGLRELSLIKTAPPKRQAIKTYIIKEDRYTLQSAIKKELQRGGQIFIVHNRVQDIEQYSAYIRELVPEASIVIGHGQLPEKDLEKRMNAFYNGEYQILIATTIIESGLDIPNANTMIVNKADMYGLAQLHQLRGRIGRSDKKAYAYFVIPKHKHLSETAEKRLKALQTYADMGSGFNIANCDLEIRGAGDLLGGEQSGHIEIIGLELYMELLQEAIRELKGEKKTFNKNIEISTPFPCFIPENYIHNSSERLRQYKRLSNCIDLEQLNQFREEFGDIFGSPPQEIRNLFTILEGRILIQHTGIKSISLSGSSLTLQFDKEILENNPELGNQVAQTFLSRPKLYQFSPDYKVLYNKGRHFDAESFLKFCRDIAQQIVPS